MSLVYQNIEESIYYFEIEDIKFYFSSLFNLNRYKEKYLSYINSEERKIINKYHLNINLRKYLLFCYYIIIEKRGFYVEIGNEKFIHKEDIKILCTLIPFRM